MVRSGVSRAHLYGRGLPVLSRQARGWRRSRPGSEEIANCSSWLRREIEILRPWLVLPIGKLAIAQFIEVPRLDAVIGRKFSVSRHGQTFDVIPLPHPSGASPWHRIPPGRDLLQRALALIKKHPALT